MVEPSQEQLIQMKRTELELLKAFITVCDKLSLRYYLVYGTLLGAVRHQGFIPWDDDIDVGMPVEDYEIFLREGQKHLPEYYFLQTLETDPEYLLNFAKIRDSRTTFVEYSVRSRKINHGLFIDIFPLYYFPDAPRKQLVMKVRQQLWKYRLRAAVEIPEVSRHNPVVEAGLQAVSWLTTLLYPNYRKAMLRRDRIQASVKPGKELVCYDEGGKRKDIMPLQWYGEGTKLSFEGIAVNCPKEYDKWLKSAYGDYMRLPPEEQRVGHHYAEVIDLDTSYTAYCAK